MIEQQPTASHQPLVSEIKRVTTILSAYAANETVHFHEPIKGPDAPEHKAAPPSPLSWLRQVFGLSDFESDILVLCAAMELDAECARVVSQLQGEAAPTFSLALAALPAAHWSALMPDSPLRRWGLVHLADERSVSRSPMRIDENIMHYLIGLDSRDPLLASQTEKVEPSWAMPGVLQTIGEQIKANWSQHVDAGETPPSLLLYAGDTELKRSLVACAAAELGFGLTEVRLEHLPADRGELATLIRALERQSLIDAKWIMVSCGRAALEGDMLAKLESVLALADLPLSVICASAPGCALALNSIHIPPVPASERAELWHQLLGDDALAPRDIQRLAYQFNLTGAEMKAACREAAVCAEADEEESFASALWEACREQARAAMPDTVERRETQVGWDGLVLSGAPRSMLKMLEHQVRNRAQVHGEWNMGTKGAAGYGISAMLSGPSGTGKTLAAEVIAHELGLDLYRIDLSMVVSKYIGETEENLRVIFDAAEKGGAVLLFDEADALFGKRSEVKDSRDRHANTEVSYLLQRVESYGGLAILTTNLKDNLDDAFLRRLRFIIDFPFPEAREREAIWRRALPREELLSGVDPERLSGLAVAGGSIRNIALNAAFVAAEQGRLITMMDVRRAAELEYDKLERSLGDFDWSRTSTAVAGKLETTS